MRTLLINPPVEAVDPYQVQMYAEAIPFGLLQIATLLEDEGHQVRTLDLMGYLDGGFETVLSAETRDRDAPCGDRTVTGVSRSVHLYGRDDSDLRERLAREPAPDEILVTCCISFNWRPAHRVIQTCRQVFPRARIRFGGFYATAYPDHARRSGADDIFEGRWEAADRVQPRLELWDRQPSMWLFRLVAGCRYRCSFCLNRHTTTEVLGDPRDIATGLHRVHREYGITAFSNWDPNVMVETEALQGFLNRVIQLAAPVRLSWEMGIQPNRLTRDLALRMQEAGTVSMTLPFETSDPALMKRFGKPYRVGEARRALELCATLGYDVSRFHCTFVLGLPDEDLGALFRTHLQILAAGGNPTPFPLTASPGTREYERQAERLAGKELDELNGHLWPLLRSPEDVALHDDLLPVLSSLDLDTARRRAACLPDSVREIFDREVERLRREAEGDLVPESASTEAETEPLVAGILPEPPLLSLPLGLHAQCATCQEREACAERGYLAQDATDRCLRPGRAVDVGEVESLLTELRRRNGLDAAAFATHEALLLAHLERLQARQSNFFEPSLGWDGRAWSFYRYSYGFHDRQPARWEEDRQEVLRWIEALDPALLPHAESLLEVVAPPLAVQLLIGLEARADAPLRSKLYVRLEEGAHPRKKSLIGALVGQPIPGAPAEELHLVGFDLGPGGVTALKLYFLRPEISASTLRSQMAGSALAGFTWPGAGPKRLRDVVLVARTRGPRPALPLAFESAHISALHNDVTLGDWAAGLAAAGAQIPLGPVASLFARFPLVVSRFSLAFAEASRTHLYYLLLP